MLHTDVRHVGFHPHTETLFLTHYLADFFILPTHATVYWRLVPPQVPSRTYLDLEILVLDERQYLYAFPGELMHQIDGEKIELLAMTPFRMWPRLEDYLSLIPS
jgi:hypothetical protein